MHGCNYLRWGMRSRMPVRMVSTMANWESRPKVKSMAKKRMAHSVGNGKRVTRSGYASKARPVPDFATSFTSTPSSVAMNPRTEKMAKPAVKEVMQLPMQTIMVSRKMLLWNLLYEARVTRPPPATEREKKIWAAETFV